jgi:3-oxoacyl-[acyl-carrier-protein] synthase III
LTYGAKILSFARALPKRIVTNKDLEELFETSDEWITQRTGIKERRIVDPDAGETATSLGAEAALNAIANAKKYSQIDLNPEQIDLIICATATGDNLFPTTACLIQNAIGAKNAVAFDISAACTGYIFALNTAYNFIKTGQFKNALVIAVDLMSKFVDWGDRRTAIIFGDGAGASLLTATPLSEDQFHPFYIKSEGDVNCSLILPNTSSKYPIKEADLNQSLTMVRMDGQAVYQFAVKIVPESIKQACDLAGIDPSELDYVIPHQANLRIIDSAARRLKIPLEKFICNIERYGNTSAASIPIALDEALELGLIRKPSDGSKLKIAFVGFGAGLTWGATVIEF